MSYNPRIEELERATEKLVNKKIELYLFGVSYDSDIGMWYLFDKITDETITFSDLMQEYSDGKLLYCAECYDSNLYTVYPFGIVYQVEGEVYGTVLQIAEDGTSTILTLTISENGIGLS